MTQPISPEDALKACCRDCRFSDENVYPMTYCHRYAPKEARKGSGALFPQVSLSDWCGEFQARTDPPVAMEALAKEFEKVDGYRGDMHRTLARIALTRIKA